MIATITPESKKGSDNPKPCIVQWTGQKRLLKVVTITYCEAELDAGIGIMQLPDKALALGMLCDGCSTAYRAYEARLR